MAALARSGRARHGPGRFRCFTGGRPPNVTVEWARPDFPALLAGCALSISQAGYNTVLDLVAARRPAIVVPFDAGNETEQAIRAEAMEQSRPGALLANDRRGGADPGASG
jgi:UDP-N-acetylglucosamine:LPS N-acetylglucosamine transferase